MEWIAILLVLLLWCLSGPTGFITALLFCIVMGVIFVYFPDIIFDPFGKNRRLEKKKQEEMEILKQKRIENEEYSALIFIHHMYIDFNDVFEPYYNEYVSGNRDENFIIKIESLYYDYCFITRPYRKDKNYNELTERHYKLISNIVHGTNKKVKKYEEW